MGGRPRLVLAVTTDLTYDQRMQRICGSLAAAGYQVLLVGWQRPASVGLTAQPYEQHRLRGFFQHGKLFYLEYNLRLLAYLLGQRAELWACADLDAALPTWLRARLGGQPFAYDAHELFTDVPEVVARPAVRRAWQWVENFIVPRAQLRYTVGPALAQLFEARHPGCPFAVVRNAPVGEEESVINVSYLLSSNCVLSAADESSCSGRGRLPANKDAVVPGRKAVAPAELKAGPEGAGLEPGSRLPTLLDQGALTVGRGLEALLEAMPRVPARLVICGVGDLSAALRARAGQLGLLASGQVEFRGYVPPASWPAASGPGSRRKKRCWPCTQRSWRAGSASQRPARRQLCSPRCARAGPVPMLSTILPQLAPTATDARPVLLAVAGPTAVGKTALTVQLARQLGTHILSADSRQFYREMRIGTARPTEAEMQGVPHHFIASHSIHAEYSAGRFATDALALLADLFRQHSVVIATGGSGLYLQALTDGLDELPAVPPQVRQQLQAELAAHGLPPLLAELAQLDPLAHQRLDLQNHQRVLRALEITRGTGRPFSSFHRGPAAVAEAAAARPFRVVKVALARPREELYQRIDQRVLQMLADGLVAEVESLLPYRQHNALQTVGYQEIFGYLDGLYDYAEAVRLLQRNTRHYAKRQLTWLRRDAGYEWVAIG